MSAREALLRSAHAPQLDIDKKLVTAVKVAACKFRSLRSQHRLDVLRDALKVLDGKHGYCDGDEAAFGLMVAQADGEEDPKPEKKKAAAKK